MRYLPLLLLLLALPLILRPLSGEPLPIEGASYHHDRYADLIQTQGLLKQDPLTGETYSFNLYDYFLALFPSFARIFIPLVLGVFMYFLFAMLLRQTPLPRKRQNYALALLLIAPAFLYAFTRYTPESLALPLLLLATAFYLQKRYLIAQTFLALTALTSPLLALCAMLLYLAQKQPFKRMQYFLPTFLTLGLSWFLHNRFTIFPSSWTFSNVFLELGGVQGFSFFIILLGLIGLVIAWKRKDVGRSLAYLLTLAASMYFPQLRLFALLLFIGYAAKTIESLLERKWSVPSLKPFTLILIGYTLLFSTILFLNTTLNAQPSGEMYQTMTALPEKEGTVFSDEENAPYIYAFMNMPTTGAFGNEQETLNISQDIWERQRAERTLKELKTLNADYVMITGNRLQGERKGLLFVLDTSGNYTKRYNSSSLELWEVKD